MSKLEVAQSSGIVIFELIKYILENHDDIIEEFFEKNPELMEEFSKIMAQQKVEDLTENPMMYG